MTVNYEGRLINGGIFDSSFLRHEPATFPLGKVIKGWGEGVPMMRVGETWEFAIPAALANRDRAIRIDEPGKTSIFKNSVLIFKIELLSLGDDCAVAAEGRCAPGSGCPSPNPRRPRPWSSRARRRASRRPGSRRAGPGWR